MKTQIGPMVAVAVLALVVGGCKQTASVSVPDVAGMTLSQASQTVKDAGLAIGTVSEETTDDVDEGLVASQSPQAGEQASEGDTVALVLSSGPARVEVPNVIGVSWERAATMMEDLGLVAEPLVTDGPVDEDAMEMDPGLIYRETPEAGSAVEKGTTIELRYWVEPG